jgi:Xaa-Pro aminopeptidase
MRIIDEARRRKIQDEMEKAHVDALLCRLGENILPLTGYWPGLWLSAALVLPDAESILICPDTEAHLAAEGWARDIRAFPYWRFGDPDPRASLVRLLKDAAAAHHLQARRIGYEGSFDLVGPAYVALEQPAIAPTVIRRVLSQAFGDATPVDASPALYAIRALKTPHELERLRVASEIAAFGLEAFRDTIAVGRAEIEVGAAVEHAVMVRGTGYKGTRLARACAQITAGPDTDAFWGYPISRPRPIAEGDPVVIEMGVVADGFWADVSRVRVAGRASNRLLELAEAVGAAQDAAAAVVRPGVRAAEVDAVSHHALLAHGMEPYVVHSLGHGLGFRYHELIPFMDPSSEDVLEQGMVFTMEPGVYVPGFAGVRFEDDVVVTADGMENLTPFTRNIGADA